MNDVVTGLEQRVQQAIRRLTELGAERDELAGEVQRLRARLAGLTESSADPTADIAWAAHRRTTIAALRETLDELRAG